MNLILVLNVTSVLNKITMYMDTISSKAGLTLASFERILGIFNVIFGRISVSTSFLISKRGLTAVIYSSVTKNAALLV